MSEILEEAKIQIEPEHNPEVENILDEMLIEISHISDEDIEAFCEQKVIPEYREVFRELGGDVQLYCVAMDRLSPEELTTLEKTNLEFWHGIHKIKAAVSAYLIYTGKIE